MPKTTFSVKKSDTLEERLLSEALAFESAEGCSSPAVVAALLVEAAGEVNRLREQVASKAEPVVDRISQDHIRKMALTLLQWGYLKNSDDEIRANRKASPVVTNGKVWTIEHLLDTVGIPYESHNEAMERWKAEMSLTAASL